MHYPLVHHQYRAVWPIAFRSIRLYHIIVLTISLLRHVLRADIHGVQRQREQTPQEEWNRQFWNVAHQETTQIGLWSHCRCYVGQYIYVFAILTVFVLSHAISTQHTETSTQHPRYFFKLSTQHQPATLKTELFFPLRVCSSATHLFVHF